MSNQEVFYYGQGEVELAQITNGVLGKWRWVNDVSSFTLNLAVEKVEHNESHSGQKGLVRSFPISKTATLAMVLHSLHMENLELTLYSKAITSEGGTVTGEPLQEGLEAGDRFALKNPSVSDLVLTDASGQPLDETAYRLRNDGYYGDGEILELPTPAPDQPFSAAYSYGPSRAVGLFTAPQPVVALRYRGINLAEGGAPVLVELYKIATDPLQELALITDGNEVAGMPLNGGILLDSSRPSDGPLGQYGRIVQLG